MNNKEHTLLVKTNRNVAIQSTLLIIAAKLRNMTPLLAQITLRVIGTLPSFVVMISVGLIPILIATVIVVIVFPRTACIICALRSLSCTGRSAMALSKNQIPKAK